MCLLFETIKVKDGLFFNLDLHSKRMNEARKALLHSEDEISLESLLTVPETCKTGIFKCRVDYDHYIHKIEFVPYVAREIKTLKIVHDHNISYKFKFAERTQLEKLKKRTKKDEILIVKNGLITDTSFSNIVFFDGKKWFTPDSPLLNGTKRQELLRKGMIFEKRIRLSHLKRYSKVRLINAMLDFDDSNELSVYDIYG
jgi:4-amino-4-deoxychorismate lyase